MKKIWICFVLIASICLGAVACGGMQEDTTAGKEDSSAMQEVSNSEAESKTDRVEISSEGETKTEYVTEETEEEETEETEESEVETKELDPRLLEDYAPVFYLDAEALYDLVADGVYEETPSLFYGYDEVTLKEESGKKYVRILTYNDYGTLAESFMFLFSETTDVAPYFTVKYRTTTPNLTMEIYSDSVNKSLNASSRALFSVVSNGEWNLTSVNLASKISAFNGETANYFRFDFMNSSTLAVDSYMEIEYIAFFKTEEDAKLFEGIAEEKVVYIDPASGFKETSLTHNTYLDMLCGKADGNSMVYDARGGNSADGIEVFYFDRETLAGGMLVFSGWTVVDGGVERFVWSADGGKTWTDAVLYRTPGLGNVGDAHINATLKETGATALKDPDGAKKGAGYQGQAGQTLPADRAAGLAADLSAFDGKTVNVTFAAVPKAEPDSLALIAHVVNVKVNVDAVEETTEAETEEVIEPTVDPSACTAHKSSENWYAVEGETREQKICLNCGTTVEARDTAFAYAIDYVEDNKGESGRVNPSKWGTRAAVIDGSALVPRTGGKDVIVGGWFACNGGSSKLMYRVNGGEWKECINQPNGTAGADLVAAIEKYNLGIKDYLSPGRFRVAMPLSDYAGQTVTVELGFVPDNNSSVVVTFCTLTGVKVPNN